jgi:hypothetical protein
MTRSDSEQRAPPRRLLALGEIVGDRAISPIGGKMLREVIELDGGSFLLALRFTEMQPANNA